MKKLKFPIILLLALCFAFAPFSAFAYDFSLDGYALDSKASFVINTNTDRVITNNNGGEKRSIASLTKIMTAVCVLENCKDLGAAVTAKAAQLSMIGNSGLVTAGLKAGESMSIENLLYCLLLPSAADAALVLADHIGGSVDSFVSMMNEKATKLGLKNTHYVDPHGLHDLAQNHYSTAEEQAKLCKYALQNETFSKIVSTAEYTVPATNLSPERKLESTNFLLHDGAYSYDKVTGIKTGFTKDAGRCLASAATNGKESYICVVLGCEPYQSNGGVGVKQFMDSVFLLENAFGNYSMKKAFGKEDVLASLHDKCFGIDADVSLVPESSFSWLLKNGETFSTETTFLNESLKAPVEKGKKLGECTISVGNSQVGKVDLVAAEAVERSVPRMILTVLLYLIIALSAIGACILIIRTVSRKKKGKHAKES